MELVEGGEEMETYTPDYGDSDHVVAVVAVALVGC